MGRQKLPQNDEAITVSVFVENLEYLNVALLKNCMEIPDFISHTIYKNLCKLEEKKRPIICANPQLRRFYYKHSDGWHLGTDFMKTLYSAIHKNAINQIMQTYCNPYLCMEKQRILLNLCNVQKYPFEKCCKKALNILGKQMRKPKSISINEIVNFQIVGDENDVIIKNYNY